LRRSPLRGHEDVVIPVATIDERKLPRRAGLPTRRMQDETGRVVPVMTDLAARRFVLADVLVTKEAVVSHVARVSRPRSRRDPGTADGTDELGADAVTAPWRRDPGAATRRRAIAPRARRAPRAVRSAPPPRPHARHVASSR